MLALAEVSRGYGGKRALHKVSAVVRPGQFVAVIGKSGAGKTTLLRCLCRAIPVTDGRICFGDRDLAALQGRALCDYRAGVGMIYQQFNLVKRLQVLDNVLIGRLGTLRGWRRWTVLMSHLDKRQRAIALRCLNHVGLLDRAWQRADTLSGGEQQRVAIAKILAQEPKIILADEPVASLDLLNGTLVMETLRRIASEARLTVIATLHQVEYARRYADRVLGLRNGQLVFDGSPDELTDTAIRGIFGEVPVDRAWVGPVPVVEPEWAVS